MPFLRPQNTLASDDTGFKFTLNENGGASFLIGSDNMTVTLDPVMNSDFIFIAAKNCTTCGGNRNYEGSSWT